MVAKVVVQQGFICALTSLLALFRPLVSCVPAWRSTIIRLHLVAAAIVSPAYAQSYVELEPNNSCGAAQGLLGTAFPLRIEGYKTQGDASAVDYFRFSAAPGTQLRVTLNGDPTKPTPLTGYGVGLFASSCPPSPIGVAFTIFSPANLDIIVPADGTFVIAVTACCDTDFSGSGTIEGAYLLSIGPNLPVKSISGQVVDRISGSALPGAVEPFAMVDLYRAGLFGFDYVATLPTTDKGFYVFSSETVGDSLPPGDYRVAASASQYQSTDSAIDLSNVQADEVRVAPTHRLLSNPVRFSGVKPCQDVPSQGGDCDFSYRVTIGTSGQLLGGVWSLVDAWGTGGMINATKFLVCEHPAALIAGSSAAIATVRCRFRVPATVPDYASFCADARFGEGSRANPHFAVQGIVDPLFCLTKVPGQTTLQVLPPAAAQRMLINRGRRR